MKKGPLFIALSYPKKRKLFLTVPFGTFPLHHSFFIMNSKYIRYGASGWKSRMMELFREIELKEHITPSPILLRIR